MSRQHCSKCDNRYRSSQEDKKHSHRAGKGKNKKDNDPNFSKDLVEFFEKGGSYEKPMDLSVKIHEDMSKFSSGSSSGRSRKDSKCPKMNIVCCDGAAIIAQIDKTVIVSPPDTKIYFTEGLGNGKSISVNEDGSRFLFEKSGFFRFIFNGYIHGTIRYDIYMFIAFHQRSIGDKDPFSKIKLSSGRASTMLPVNAGDSLEISVEAEDGRPVVLEAGTKIEIYLVDSIGS